MISYTTDNTPNFALETVATYSCITGFYVVAAEVRTCMDDDGMDAIGIWIGEPPTCVRKLEWMCWLLWLKGIYNKEYVLTNCCLRNSHLQISCVHLSLIPMERYSTFLLDHLTPSEQKLNILRYPALRV